MCILQVCKPAAVAFKLDELFDHVSNFEVHLELIDITDCVHDVVATPLVITGGCLWWCQVMYMQSTYLHTQHTCIHTD